jgi:hypothetical protein
MSVFKSLAQAVINAYKKLVTKFLSMIAKIKSLNPAYKQPGDGTDGTCDCIGLIIGAIQRMGLKWTGIHGSNYAARYQTVDLEYIERVSDLELGDVIYKACDKDGRVRKACNGGSISHKYDLPNRYKPTGAYYNHDLNDYYHVGAVTSVSPLQITHMTSPRMKVDTNLNGGWNYHGKAKPIVDAAGKDGGTTASKAEDIIKEPIATSDCKAIVVADNGKPVKLRQYPSTSCKTWDSIPCGTEVTIIDPGEEWAKINCGKRKGWYMMAQFLDIVGDGKGKY